MGRLVAREGALGSNGDSEGLSPSRSLLASSRGS
jgi:hypothetical protein